MKLTTKARKNLSAKQFAGPDRSYPINDKNHARNALSRVSQFGTPSEQAKDKVAEWDSQTSKALPQRIGKTPKEKSLAKLKRGMQGKKR